MVDMASVLGACLQTGELARAAVMVRRLGNIFWADAPELLDAHNAYLGALVARVVATGDARLLRAAHRWFHVDMLGHRPPAWLREQPRGVRPDAYTIALLVRASMVEPSELKVARSIRYYLRRARDYEIYDEARVAVLDQLSSEDAARVVRYDAESFRNVKELVEEALAAAEADQDADETLAATEEYSEADAPIQPALSVRSQEQKGLGLVALKRSLSVLSEEQSLEEDQPLRQRQELLEKSTVSSALDRWRKEHDEMEHQLAINSSLQSRPIGALLWSWHKDLLPLIEDELQKIKEFLDRPNMSRKSLGKLPRGNAITLRYREADYAIYGPFMRFISPEKLSATTILSTIHFLMMKAKDSKMVTAASLFKAVGRAVEEESQVEAMKLHKEKGLKRKLPSREKIKRLTKLIRRVRGGSVAKAAEKALKQTGDQSRGWMDMVDNWPTTIVVKVGGFLISKLLDAAKVSVRKGSEGGRPIAQQEPALSWLTTFMKGRRIGHLAMHPELMEVFRKEPMGSAIAKHLPMLIPPKPWKGYTEGGFLHQPLPVVRMLPEYTQTHEYCKLAVRTGDMDQLFAGLDILGRTKWKVNRRVFDVMLNVWNSGEALAGIPPAEASVEFPEPPPPGADEATLRNHKCKVTDLKHLRDGIHSNRCFVNFQMEVAKAFLHQDFYLPHNLDFRGRAYPIPPYFNHMGADNCRGLMLFGEGRPLGPDGLHWLRIHLANVYGFDKASLADRKQWAIDNTDEVRDSATNPLGGRRWWLKAEDPWQCLATCLELHSASNSPNPVEYISHLPVHQDGTCNGLQHYAALGGDEMGARQVNLEPGPKPSDIYSGVAQMVAEDVARDAANDHPLAKILDGKINRKIVKQTVMTNVYGVTKMGAQQQVCKHLEDLYPKLFPLTRHYVRAASYVSTKIFAALSQMFNGASAIQTWLGECGARISMSITPDQIQALAERNAAPPSPPTPVSPKNSRYRLQPVGPKSLADEFSRFRSSIIWTTPLKMPVVQPYRKPGVRRVETHLQGVHLADPSVADPVDKRKQLQAFAPNFIHSLDATHMMLSALACHARGLTFASVHDSFWTHAADVAPMNEVIRDAFVRMHAEDIMGRLAAEFAARYKGSLYLAAVPRFSPLGERITERRRAAAGPRHNEDKRQIAELIEENRRQRLLRSADPAERAAGAAMPTAAALWDTADKATDLAPPKRLPRDALEAAVLAAANAPAVDAGGAPAITAADADEGPPPPPPPPAGPAPEPALPDPQQHPGFTKSGAKRRRLSPEMLAHWRLTTVTKTWLWLPLEFPAVPAKV